MDDEVENLLKDPDSVGLCLNQSNCNCLRCENDNSSPISEPPDIEFEEFRCSCGQNYSNFDNLKYHCTGYFSRIAKSFPECPNAQNYEKYHSKYGPVAGKEVNLKTEKFDFEEHMCPNCPTRSFLTKHGLTRHRFCSRFESQCEVVTIFFCNLYVTYEKYISLMPIFSFSK